VENELVPRPSSYTLNKLKSLDCVELYYFTPKGCSNTSATNHTTAHDALTATRLNNQLIFQPLAAYRPSSKVVPDSDLTWTEVLLAKTSLLNCMQEAGWLEVHLNTLSTFFYKLDSHSMR
ncbi:hypothetical protein FA15DRAFT_546067, partial [Coprinopsis marcescibilis]